MSGRVFYQKHRQDDGDENGDELPTSWIFFIMDHVDVVAVMAIMVLSRYEIS